MFTDNQSIRALKALLKLQYCSQVEISEESGVSKSYICEVLGNLEKYGVIARPYKNRVRVVDNYELLRIVSCERPLSAQFLGSYYFEEASEGSLEKVLGIPHAFTLFSALKRYSALARSEKVQLYVLGDSQKTDSWRKLRIDGHRARHGNVEIYLAEHGGILHDSSVVDNVTLVSKEQLLLDLFSAGGTYIHAGQEFLEEYLGAKK